MPPKHKPKKKQGKRKKNSKSHEKQKKERVKPSEEDEDVKEEDSNTETLLMGRKQKRSEGDSNAAHMFWDTQPVPNMKAKVDADCNAPIEVKQVSEVRAKPYLLPEAFEWVELDLASAKELDELYHLLAEHYVEDDDNMFRFNYSKEFLQWALLVPGYRKDWHLGVRVAKTGALCGCITAIPALVQIYDKSAPMVEINFLCVHKRLRSKRLAPVLIKEVTRRVNMQNRWQACYTAGVILPKPIAQNRYWHRSLNPKKLIDIQFSSLRRRMTMPRLLKLYRVDDNISTPGLRELRESDCIATHALLCKYLAKFQMFIHFSLAEFKHLLLPRKNVVYSYVVENPQTKQITDFISYYQLPSTVINHPKHDEMRAAYCYYCAITETDAVQLMNDALVLANKQGFDVFNALDVMENNKFLERLKFGIGDGHLQYYLYNWKAPELKPSQVGIVLL